ncbi:UDP-N-acetylmuramoyl-L-alanyl-D-glutamate--2,6-diaminopimelate ligase [Bacillus sp. J14TS2]|uniref:UDP-N-acetylmuramoyl-L-alanyl-D-glutamate--2, 6-diaminopimelate ligase n=1 Tax=Bacillus sp. J14TS2 TaxID=2807188 RepID=UPI001B19622A|nr:UDP-N-acetylmuramoyl-L-alanyl-D-glutamate--2,6-diaminopimelate ligase [Bacillus sp. J14TS2]GIN74376.1 UDP-N-acetylmuramoyl-L-alanyl-D-glutamate--2,6-diaminopimelate ligase [Bacillus sp. J14TS2]
MNLRTLIQSLPFIGVPEENNEITGISNNHQKVEKGHLFICIKGHAFDGHNFAEEAVNNGAVAVVAEKPLQVGVPVILVKDTKKAMAILGDAFYHHPSQKIHLIGITGTNGKTTTSHMIDSIFHDAKQETGLIGTINIKIGNKVLETKNTTPDSLELQKVFHEMVKEKIDTAIMEVSSHALVQGRVNGCDYDVAVFTNLSQDHLDYHHTMEEYRRAKSLLFSKLGNTYSTKHPKFAVLNADDEISESFASETSAHVITYGVKKSADFQADSITYHSNGVTFTLLSPEGKREVHLPLAGEFNVYNALAAIATAYVSNIPFQDIIKSIEQIKGVPGRFELVDGGQQFSVIVDYAHTPDGLENVLRTIQQFAEKRVFCVVGCGGDRDPSKRPLMAKIACKWATDPIFTSDNPRIEDPNVIIEDMEKGVEGEQFIIEPNRKKAIECAIALAEAGDVVLVAGKGHETYQIIGDQVHDFDDRLVSLEAIRKS